MSSMERSDADKTAPMTPSVPLIPEERQTSNDLTGRDRLVANVLFSWGGHFVFIIAGFIMPRMISQRLGQNVLGIWDFCWSLTSYFFMIEAGIGGAVSRYVAKHHAAGDIAGLNRTISSGACVLGAAGATVLGATIAVSLLLPQFFGARLGAHVHEAQWVVFFLGAGLAAQISCSPYGGVLSGCHRWGLLNMNGSGWYAGTVVVMIAALLLGGGLPSLAAITFGGLVLTYITQILLAHHVCEGLRVRPSQARWKTVKDLYAFGGKSLVPIISKMLLNQTTSVLIVAYLGPAALALYARPRSLMRHVDKLVQGMARTLTPTASSLQRRDSLDEIQDLLISATRYSLYLVLPMVLMLVFFGGTILEFWMGPRYANPIIPMILAAGFFFPSVQWSSTRILVGLNAHGRAGLGELVASIGSVGLAFLMLGVLRWGLVGAALAVTLPLTVMNVIYLPYLICRRLRLGVKRYFMSALIRPAVYVLPFALCLAAARIGFNSRPLVGLACGGAVGSVLLAVLYYKRVLPQRIKKCLNRIVGLRRSLA